MEAVELTEPPSVARRRLSATLGAGIDGKRRHSLLALEHPSVLDSEPSARDDADSKPHADDERRASVSSRRASTISRIFALASTSESFKEERVLPTKINAMIFLDDPHPDVEGLRQVLAERLLDIPRFRCAVKNGEGGTVVFEPLPRSEVNVQEHITHVNGTGVFGDDDVEGLINEAYLEKWHAGMPLWRMKIITNLGDGRSLLFASVDHAIGDGAGLLSVFLSLFDDDAAGPGENGNSSGRTPKSNPMLRGEKRRPTGLSRSHRALAVLKGLWAGVVITLAGPPIDIPHGLMIPKNRVGDPSMGKDFAQTRAFPLEEVLSMKSKLNGATVNDIIAALLAMAITKYLDSLGDGAMDSVRRGKGTIRASFPVNMRQKGEGGLGNDLVIAYMPLPIDCSDPVDYVWKAKTYIDEMKLSPAFAISKAISNAIFHAAPASLLAGRLLDVYTRSTCMLSNVNGPGGATTIGGYPIDDLGFTVSYPGNLYFGVLSFGGKLRVSGILDRKVGGDLEKLMGCFEDSHDELKAVLENVDEKEPIQRPDMTPTSAKVLECLLYISAVALPLLVAVKFSSS